MHPEEKATVEHTHEWEPFGTVTEDQILYSPVSAMDHVKETVTYAVRSCRCGAVRRTAVASKSRWLNR